MPYSGDNIHTDVQTAIAAGAALGDPRVVPLATDTETGMYTVVPEGYKLESLEDFMARPLRVRQTVDLHDAASFIQYAREFGDISSVIFFDQEHERFELIVDYHHADGQPSWCDHIASFATRRSEEFKTWMAQNKKQMTQVDFARFLEDNLPDIVEPAGATLLEIALTFEAKKDVEFASGIRLQNGQVQFQYNEIVRGAAQKGTLEVQEQFVLGIAVHVGGPAYRIPVRFRWRLHEGKAIFWYEIVRPHRFVEDALKDVRDHIAADTGLGVLAGVAK